MEKTFEVEKKTIEELYFSPNGTYSIPQYQRPYKWTKDNWAEFWESVLNENDNLYLGTVIYFKDNTNKNNREIIDGQQRYLTITILAAAARDSFAEMGKADLENQETYKDKAKGWHEELIGKYDRKKECFINYLTTGKSSRKYFEENIQKSNIKTFYSKGNKNETLKIALPDKSSEEQKNIYDCYNFFKNRIKNYLEKNNNPKSSYADMYDRLAQEFVVSITISHYDTAFEIFETVNNSGIDLTVSDLIKNQILKNIARDNNNEIDAADEKWNGMVTRLENCRIKLSPQEFLRYYWASKYDYVSDKSLYDAIKKELKSKEDSNPKCWEELLEDLELESENYVKIIENEKKTWEEYYSDNSPKNIGKTYKAMGVLIKMGKTKTWIVLIMSLYRNFSRLKITDSKKLSNHLIKLQKFTFLYFGILKKPGNAFWTKMYSKAIKINNAKNQQEVSSELEDLYKWFCDVISKTTTEEFDEKLKLLSYQKEKQNIRYILEEMELKERGKFNTGWDPSALSLEHYIPQKPESNWKYSDGTPFKKEDTKKYLHQISNIIIMGSKLNGKLGNLSSVEKVKEIKEYNDGIKLLENLTKNIENKTWDFNNIDKSNKEYPNCISNRMKNIELKCQQIFMSDFKTNLGY